MKMVVAGNNMLSILHRTRKLHCLRRFSTLVDLSQADPSLDAGNLIVVPEVISEKEGDLLWNSVRQRVERRRYNKGHWDGVILGYREAEVSDDTLPAEVLQVIYRVRNVISRRVHEAEGIATQFSWMPVHVLDLSAQGSIDAHVDAVKFSGRLVCGVSLLSPAIMTLRAAGHVESSSTARLFLPPRSLYILRGAARYFYSHAMRSVKDGPQTWAGKEVPALRRVSMIFRDSVATADADMTQAALLAADTSPPRSM